ncbi:MAG: hypothetical protein OHM77_02130 [Candidatus Nitricoxidivorans perseverans]|uniref:Uncharacterized protein n=1 Tax=Candidatus Nitricoxidivorans perseverans TaxID=2975601 RepID=A0AA49FLK7_9PROT|nr:MAG: hypothetical protein OHM77_02130 [Candidatus Nitricoxidivorans perseverans]
MNSLVRTGILLAALMFGATVLAVVFWLVGRQGRGAASTDWPAQNLPLEPCPSRLATQ